MLCRHEVLPICGVQSYPVHRVWKVAVSVFTFAATITNWMAGLVATFLRHAPPLRWLLRLGPRELLRALLPCIKVTAAASGVILLLWLVQRLLFPTAPTFKIGRAHVCTPVTNEHLVIPFILVKKKQRH